MEYKITANGRFWKLFRYLPPTVFALFYKWEEKNILEFNEKARIIGLIQVLFGLLLLTVLPDAFSYFSMYTRIFLYTGGILQIFTFLFHTPSVMLFQLSSSQKDATVSYENWDGNRFLINPNIIKISFAFVIFLDSLLLWY